MVTYIIILVAAIGGTGSLTAILTWLAMRDAPPHPRDEAPGSLAAELETVRHRLVDESERNRDLVERIEFLEHLLEGRELPHTIGQPTVRQDG